VAVDPFDYDPIMTGDHWDYRTIADGRVRGAYVASPTWPSASCRPAMTTGTTTSHRTTSSGITTTRGSCATTVTATRHRYWNPYSYSCARFRIVFDGRTISLPLRRRRVFTRPFRPSPFRIHDRGGWATAVTASGNGRSTTTGGVACGALISAGAVPSPCLESASDGGIMRPLTRGDGRTPPRPVNARIAPSDPTSERTATAAARAHPRPSSGRANPGPSRGRVTRTPIYGRVNRSRNAVGSGAPHPMYPRVLPPPGPPTAGALSERHRDRRPGRRHPARARVARFRAPSRDAAVTPHHPERGPPLSRSSGAVDHSVPGGAPPLDGLQQLHVRLGAP
jgi:hypothetical protein